MKYDERKLHTVTLGLMDPFQSDDGPMVGTSITISVSSPDGEQSGPNITAQFAVPATPSSSLEEIRDQSVRLGYELIQRIARESLQDIQAASNKTPLFVFPKD